MMIKLSWLCKMTCPALMAASLPLLHFDQHSCCT